MTDVNEVLKIHDILIEKFGGLNGLRDSASLESALSRPYATFDQNELYPDVASKAAAILESIVINHPFVDGNKRTGYVLMRIFLLKANKDIYANQDEKYQLVMAVSKGEMRFEEIRNWVLSHLAK